MTADSRRPAARGYHSPRREEQAAATRAAVLAAARDLFVAQGYAGTTVAQIARSARVAVDTVYANGRAQAGAAARGAGDRDLRHRRRGARAAA